MKAELRDMLIATIGDSLRESEADAEWEIEAIPLASKTLSDAREKIWELFRMKLDSCGIEYDDDELRPQFSRTICDCAMLALTRIRKGAAAGAQLGCSTSTNDHAMSFELG